MHNLELLECIHAHHIFVLQSVYCAFVCDLVDVPEFYEEACDCPDCTPTNCQGKWHMKIPIYILTMHLVVLFLYMHV